MLDDNARTGIDVIDGEHARLAALLEKAEVARVRGHRQTVARLLRSFIEAFDRHFAAETRLLRQLGRGDFNARDLDRRHSEFITSRSWMVSHPVDVRDPEQVARIVQYARAWLHDHVMRQDGAIAETLESRSPRKGALRWLRLNALPLKWRMAAMAAVPLAIMLGLASLLFVSLINELSSARSLRDVVRLNASIGDLVFELQEEADRAIMVVGSPRHDRGGLDEQVLRTNAAVAAFQAAEAPLRSGAADRALTDALDNADSSLALIGQSRSDVERGSYDVYSTIEYYDTTVRDLMEVAPNATRRLDFFEDSRRVIAYLFMLRARERAGAERSLGTSLLAGVTVNVLLHDPRMLSELSIEQESFARTFATLADSRFADAYAAATSVSPMLAYMRRAMETEEADRNSFTARDWSDTTGLRIERMRAVERKVGAEIDKAVDDNSAETRRHVAFLGGGIAAAIALSVAFTALIGWGVLPPLRRLGDAVRRLAEGDRIVALPDAVGQDDIAVLAHDVVALRNRLIQGDLLEARRGTENADRLRATLAGLPGVVFRIAQVDGAPMRLVAASEKLHHLTGLSDAEVLDRPLGSLMRVCIDPEDRISLLHVLRRIGRSPLDFECRLRKTPDERVRWVRILATPVDTGSGCLWDGVALDVTLAKQAEMERGRLTEELERLHRAQTTNRITLSLGADLAQIWAPLRQNAEALMRELAPDSPLYARANEIRTVGERTRRLAEQLALMRDSERASAPVDLVQRLETRIENLRRDLPAGLVLETSFGARSTTVRCAAADQLVANLAVYVAETLGAEAGVITIGTDLQASGARRHLRIFIADARSGLASRIFSKVLRLRSSRMEKVSGEELSLAIVRLIVDAAQGWVQSSAGAQGGSVLEIFLPVWEGLGHNVIRLERSVS